jgi:DNA (cytosine-5)-methyltransferase 1
MVVFDGKQVTSKDNRSNPRPGAPCHTLASGNADSAVICLEGNGTRPSHQGSGINDEGVCFTLNTIEKHAVCYQDTVGSLCASDHKWPQQQQVDEKKFIVEQDNTEYTVRRLVPQECAMLQGFDPDWCADLETPEPTEDDINFWINVFEVHRNIMGTSDTPKSRSQIIKWLQNPHNDGAEYKMWGNGVALPCVRFVMAGIVWALGL